MICSVSKLTASKKMPGGAKMFDDILENIAGAVPDTGKTLKEYREELR